MPGGRPAYVVNPPDVDELCDLARVTGVKGIYRHVHLHALNLMNYCHPSILALVRQDEEHGSELLETLFAYLQNSANTARTAQLLNIHKNTLLYRLGRIKEVLGNDLTSGEDLFLYHLSIRVLIYLGAFEPRARPRTSASLRAKE